MFAPPGTDAEKGDPTHIYISRPFISVGEGEAADPFNIEEWAASQSLARALSADRRVHVVHPARVWKTGEAWVCAVTSLWAHESVVLRHNMHWNQGSTLSTAIGAALKTAAVLAHATGLRRSPPSAWESSIRHAGRGLHLDSLPIFVWWNHTGDATVAVGGVADMRECVEGDAAEEWARMAVCVGVWAAMHALDMEGDATDAACVSHMHDVVTGGGWSTSDELLSTLSSRLSFDASALRAAARAMKDVVRKGLDHAGSWNFTHAGLFEHAV